MTWSASDSGGLAVNPITIQYSVNEGNTWTNIVSNEANDGTYSWSLPSISTNEARIKVLAEDAIGNVGSDTSNSNFVIDTTAPSAPTLVSPSNNSSTNETTPAFTWNSLSDISGITSYEISINGSLTTQGATTSYTPGSSLSEGTKQWKVRGKNGVGLWSEYSTTYILTIDATGPSAPVLVTPANGATITDTTTPTLTWEASTDLLSSIASYEINLDGSLITQDATTSYTVGNALSDGLHTWEVRAKNGINNWGSYSTSFTFIISSYIENQAPISTIEASGISLKNEDYIDSTPHFDIKITDNTTIDADSIILTFDNKKVSYSTIISQPSYMQISYTPEVKLESEDVKKYSIKIEAADILGNIGTKEVDDLKVSSASSSTQIIGPVLSYPTKVSPLTGESAKITYTLNKDAQVAIYMFSANGTIVFNKTFSSGENGGKAGYNEVIFNGKSTITGSVLGNGIYVYKIISGNKILGKAYIVIYD